MFVLISQRVGKKLSNEDSCKLLQGIERQDSNETVESRLSQPISNEYKKFIINRGIHYLMLMGKVSYGGSHNLSYGRDVEIIRESRNNTGSKN